MTVATTGQKTILVIEDDPWTRTITTALLAGEGFAVVEAKNGEEGLRRAHEHAPDAVLLDLALPTKSGLEVLRELKRDISTMGTNPFGTILFTHCPNRIRTQGDYHRTVSMDSSPCLYWHDRSLYRIKHGNRYLAWCADGFHLRYGKFAVSHTR